MTNAEPSSRIKLESMDYIFMLLLWGGTIATVFLGSLLYRWDYPDSEKYILLFSLFRGEIPVEDLVTPFSYRPLLPYIASLIPTDASIAFAITNSAFLLILSTTLYLICRNFEITRFGSFLSAAACMATHQVAAYGAAVLVDTPAIMCMAVAALLMLQDKDNEKWYLTSVVLMIGTAFRETVLLMALAYVLHTRVVRHAIPIILGPLLVHLGIRMLFTPPAQTGFVWIFSLLNLTDRLPTTLIMVQFAFQNIIVFLLIGLVLLRGTSWAKGGMWYWLWTIGVPLAGITALGLFFGYFTSRFIWPLYIAIIPIVALGVDWVLSFIKKRIGLSSSLNYAKKEED
ncbi:MAG: hypothetical protein ACXABV_08220 [Candidatus Thorarchaeota archaeon]